MDNNNIFQYFVNNVQEVEISLFCTKIFGFVNNFSTFMSITDQYIDSFVKEIHYCNSVRPPNGKVFILSKILQYLNLVFFGLKDRQKCA